MRNGEELERPSGPARPDSAPARPRPHSIAKRLFFSAALLSFVILLVAGLVLSTIYRRTAEANFDERLGAYLHALVADIATPGEDSRTAPGQLGEPQFELALSGWYWQITRLDAPKPEIRSSRSLFAAKLPRLSDAGVAPGAGGARKGYATGPDDRILRMRERIIDTGDQGIYLVQVAATTEEIEAQISRFEIDLVITFAVLA
ncbi:MAG: sensor histidine kinase, partial [Methylocella sp.]